MSKLTVGTENSTPIELHYEDHGTGKPVVLIHGWPLSGRSWENQIPALIEAGHRVITYDRRGFGDSSQPWDGYDYDTFAADLNTLLTELDLREVTLVGFSMGGGEVVRYIATFGTDRIVKAVLAAAVPPYLYKSADNPDGGLDDATIGQFEAGVKGDRLAFLEDFSKKFFSAGGKLMVSESQRVYARNIAAFASPKGTLDCIGAFARTDFRDDLTKIKIPTLVLHGDSDDLIPLPNAERLVAGIPGATLKVYPSTGHMPQLERRAEFLADLRGFLGKLEA